MPGYYQGQPGGQTAGINYNPNTPVEYRGANAQGAQAQYMYGQRGTGDMIDKGPSQAAQDQMNLAHVPVDAQMSRFNAILPLLTGQLGQLGNGGAFRAGGENTAPPPISAGPTLNPQQIQQQVNQSNANVDKSTASNIQHSNESLGGRGFGSNSPLARALEQGYQNNGLATRTGNETNLRLNAAQSNAGQLLNSQQALSNQWATGNDLDIKRRQPYIQQQTALLGALAGMV